jgi:hypothetical protein
MGRVFLGASPGGRKVAIKIVHPNYANDPEFHRRFAREVAAARQVGGFHAPLVVDTDPDADPCGWHAREVKTPYRTRLLPPSITNSDPVM